MPRVNPDVLIWARESMGYTVEEAAKKLGFKDGVRGTAIEKLMKLEAGEKDPTRPQLLKMSQHYRKPLLSLYMRQPPERADRGEDYRTLPAGLAPEENALLDVLIRDVQARQSLLRETLIQEDEAEPLQFIGTLRMQAGAAEAAQSLRELLQFDLQQFRRQQTVGNAFKYARELAERSGIFVLLIGNLGSHHTNISTSTFRGFALADDVAPFIVVNDQDAQSAWTFTLMHEIVHLLLAQTGVSNAYADNQVERFCNDVASEVLLPANELRDFDVGDNDIADLTTAISRYASPKKISGRMVAYRLFRSDQINEQVWRLIDRRMNEIWLDTRNRQRDVNRDSDGGPSYYVVRRHKLGGSLLNVTQRMMNSGALTATRAGFLLGVKPLKLHRLFQPTTAV